MRRLQVAMLFLPWLWPCLTVSGQDAGPAASLRGGNLLVNGGFEEWVSLGQLSDGILRRPEVKHVRRVPDSLWPRQWIVFRTINQSGPPGSGEIARDEQVAHHGRYSLRITNHSTKDICSAQYSTESAVGSRESPPPIRPNRRYQLSWWVKGTNVLPGGGPRLDQLIYYTRHEGALVRVAIDVRDQDEPPTGTFDWQRHQYAFATDAGTQWLSFNLQLRTTAGTVWFDDVELHDCGPAVTVETY